MASKAKSKTGHDVSEQSEATLTVLTTDHGIITKECFLDAGGALKKSHSPNFASGAYQVVSVPDLKAFQKVRYSLSKSQALMYGTPIDGSAAGRITTKKRRHTRCSFGPCRRDSLRQPRTTTRNG